MALLMEQEEANTWKTVAAAETARYQLHLRELTLVVMASKPT